MPAMRTIHATASQEIDARPEAVYAVLADYRVGHPAILPKPYFEELKVEAGGRGAGTRLRLTMRVMGVTSVFHEVVTEPEPGRVLAESDAAAGVTTTFTVDPLDGGKRARVTIVTETRASPGVKGLVERLITPGVLRGIYRQELRQLEEYVKETTS